MKRCPVCNVMGSQDNMVTFEPDPFDEEINDDHKRVWMCRKCREKSADEI